MIDTASKSEFSFRTYIILSTIWYFSAYLISKMLTTLPFGIVIIVVFIFAIPLTLSGLYSITVNKTRIASFYRLGGWAYWFISGRIIKSSIWIVWSLIASFAMLVLFVSYSWMDWFVLASLIPIYWVAYFNIRNFLSGEIRKNYLLTGFSITWAKWLCVFLVIILYAALIMKFGKSLHGMSLLDIVNNNKNIIAGSAKSDIVRMALEISTFNESIREWIVQHFGNIFSIIISDFKWCFYYIKLNWISILVYYRKK